MALETWYVFFFNDVLIFSLGSIGTRSSDLFTRTGASFFTTSGGGFGASFFLTSTGSSFFITGPGAAPFPGNGSETRLTFTTDGIHRLSGTSMGAITNRAKKTIWQVAERIYVNRNGRYPFSTSLKKENLLSNSSFMCAWV